MYRFGRLALTLVCMTGIGCGSSTVSTAPSANSGQASSAAQSAIASQKAAPTPAPVIVVGARCDRRPMKFDAAKIDLTGAWLPNDGGIYYIRQLGKTTWWNGMSQRDRPAAQL